MIKTIKGTGIRMHHHQVHPLMEEVAGTATHLNLKASIVGEGRVIAGAGEAQVATKATTLVLHRHSGRNSSNRKVWPPGAMSPQEFALQ